MVNNYVSKKMKMNSYYKLQCMKGNDSEDDYSSSVSYFEIITSWVVHYCCS